MIAACRKTSKRKSTPTCFAQQTTWAITQIATKRPTAKPDIVRTSPLHGVKVEVQITVAMLALVQTDQQPYNIVLPAAILLYLLYPQVRFLLNLMNVGANNYTAKTSVLINHFDQNHLFRLLQLKLLSELLFLASELLWFCVTGQKMVLRSFLLSTWWVWKFSLLERKGHHYDAFLVRFSAFHIETSFISNVALASRRRYIQRRSYTRFTTMLKQDIVSFFWTTHQARRLQYSKPRS
jgi:hypothetical protein